MARLICLFALATVGCVTPYQHGGFAGGFDEVHLKRGQWIVEVRGNGFTSRLTLIGYLNRRARELCAAEGFDDYDLTAIASESATEQAPSEYHAQTRRTYGGGSETSVTEDPGISVTKHTVSSPVRCHMAQQAAAQ